jgi:hypothetical protein
MPRHPVDHQRTLAHILTASRGRAGWSGLVDDPLLSAAREQNVALLLYQSLRVRDGWDRQPDAVRDELSSIAASAALVEEVRREHGRGVIDALHSAGLAPVIFKGSALAYRHYPHAWLRPRLDTDLFIRADQLSAATAVLTGLGLIRSLRPTGDHVTHQQTWQTTTHGIRHQYDVHWKLSDPQAFADVISYDEASRDAVPLPALGPSARTVSDVHALLIACVHRVAHHFNSTSLVWMYDIDLVARALDEPAWNQLAVLAADKRIRQVCAHGLTLAQQSFGTPVPPHVLTALRTSDTVEPTAVYLRGDLRRVDILRSDLQALTWRGRLRLLREHLLPAPSYVLRSYGQSQPLLLPFLYLHRIARGAVQWFRPLRNS